MAVPQTMAQFMEVVECKEDELLKVSWDVYSCGCYVKSENKIYVLKDKEYEEGTWDYQVISRKSMISFTKMEMCIPAGVFPLLITCSIVSLYFSG